MGWVGSLMGLAVASILLLQAIDETGAARFRRWAFRYGLPVLRFEDAASFANEPQSGETERAAYHTLPDGVILVREHGYDQALFPPAPDPWTPDLPDPIGVRLTLEPTPSGWSVRARSPLAHTYAYTFTSTLCCAAFVEFAQANSPWAVAAFGVLVVQAAWLIYLIRRRTLQQMARVLYAEVRTELSA